MEHYKISKLLNNLTVSKFLTRKWIKVNDLSRGQYPANKNTRCKTAILRSDLYGYSDTYTVVKRTTTVTGTNNNNRTNDAKLH